MKVNCEKLKMYIPNPRSRTKKRNKNKTNNLTKKGKKKPILKQSRAKKQTTKTKQMQNFQSKRKYKKRGGKEMNR